MIRVENLSKTFGEETVLHNLSFELPAEQTLSILGKSGGGKSTLLRIMAGLETADTGSFQLAQKQMLGLAPQLRNVVYLSQEPLLFPHLSVADNLGFGLAVRKVARPDIDTKVHTLAEQLGLSDQLTKYPNQLSGGQKQRVNFGRALIISPQVLLLDEPFGSLDAHTRKDMQELFQHIRKTYQITALFVTHDLKEALLMGDQIGTLIAGQLKIYPTVGDFIQAPESGVKAELEFWQKWQ